jgi:hypothetical protein
MVVLGVVSNLLSLAFGQLSRSTIIIIIIMLIGSIWLFSKNKPLKCCSLIGKFLYLQELSGLKVLCLQSYPQGIKHELFWAGLQDEIYYQIAPNQKKVIVEIHQEDKIYLYLIQLVSNKQVKLLIAAPGIKAAIWLNKHKIAFWHSGVEKHLNLETGRLNSLRSVDYLSFLQRHFRTKIKYVKKVISLPQFQIIKQLEEEADENDWQASLMFLRTIGIPLQPPLLNVYIDVPVLGREASPSPDGEEIVYTTNERALCIVKRSSKRILIYPPPRYRFFHPRWIDKNHLIVGLSRSLDIPAFPSLGEWKLGIVHLHYYLEGRESVEVVAHGWDGKWLYGGARW